MTFYFPASAIFFCLAKFLGTARAVASKRVRILARGGSSQVGARLVLAVGLIGATKGQAQSGSAPVGVMTYAVAENSTISLGVPLLRPAVFVGSVTGFGGKSLTVAGAGADAPWALVAGAAYFVEVIGHVDGATSGLVGQRFEVDEVATLASGVGAVVLDSTSALNTASVTTLVDLANYRVVMRPHWTLAALLGTGPGGKINASVSVTAADQVLAWSGAGFSVFYLRSGEVPQWRNTATGAANQDGAILPPGAGLFLRRQAGALTFAIPGEVRTNVFVRPPLTGSQIIAGGFPIDSSPADLKLAAGPGLTLGPGLTPGTSPSNSDQLLSWETNAFSVYYLRDGQVPHWRNASTGLLDYSNTAILSSRGASLLLLRSPAAAATSRQLIPFSL